MLLPVLLALFVVIACPHAGVLRDGSAQSIDGEDNQGIYVPPATLHTHDNGSLLIQTHDESASILVNGVDVLARLRGLRTDLDTLRAAAELRYCLQPIAPVPFQATSPRSFAVFEIEGEIYIAIMGESEHASPPPAVTSTIMRWNSVNGAFEEVQSLETVAGKRWEFFSIDNRHFLAYSADAGTFVSSTASPLYLWDSSTRKFEPFQTFSTYNLVTWNFLTINGVHFLVAAQELIQGDADGPSSPFFRYDPGAEEFETSASVTQPTAIAEVNAFEVSNITFLCIAQQTGTSGVFLWSSMYQTAYPLTTITLSASQCMYVNIDGTHAVILGAGEVNPQRSTLLLQSNASPPDFSNDLARTLHHPTPIRRLAEIAVDNRHFLAALSAQVSSSPSFTTFIYLYEYNRETSHFEPYQTIETSATVDIAFKTYLGVPRLLALTGAQVLGQITISAVYTWNGCTFSTE